MKKFIIIFIVILFLFNNLKSQTVVFSEDFENSGSIPSGWTIEHVVGNIDWQFQTGGSNNHPDHAASGTYNAAFYITSHNDDGSISRLITPEIDLSGSADYTLTFYRAHEMWNSDQDTLKVYYRTSSYDSWHLIATFDNNQASWKKTTLGLPNPSSTYQIAFEGIAYYGYGVCIDLVKITSVQRLSTEYTCSALFYDSGGESGDYSNNENWIKTFCSDNNSCIRAVVDYYDLEADYDYLLIYDGMDASGDLLAVINDTSADFDVTSTLDDNGTAYYGLSGCLTFEFYSDGATTDDGWKIELECPENCYPPSCSQNDTASDVCESATPLCNLDGYCGNTSDAYTADHTELNTDNGGPFCGTIDNNSWLTFIADSTVALIDVWTENCTGIPPYNRIHGIQIQIYDSDCNTFVPVSNCWSPNKEANGRIRAEGLTPGHEYKIMIDGWGGDNCQYYFAVPTNAGVVVASAGEDQTMCEGETVTLTASGGNSVTWTSDPYDPSLIGQENNMTIYVSPHQTTTYTATVSGGNSFCSGSTADVTVFVDAANSYFTGLDSSYCINSSAVTLNGNYDPYGTFSGDGISGNTFDPASAGVGQHTITYTYDYDVVTIFEDDFDPQPQPGWTHGGTNGDSWEWGNPQGGNGSSSFSNPDPVMDHSSSNTDNNVYGEGLSDGEGSGIGGYYNNSQEWLLSPSFDCSNIRNTTLNFWRYCNVEDGYDGAVVEITTDGGNTWHTLWSGYPQDDEWTFQSINISAYADGQSNVQVRWRTHSDGSITYSGWNIDDVRITGVQNGGSCTSTYTRTTEVVDEPYVFAGNDTMVCAYSDSIQLHGIVSGSANQGLWSTEGDGSFTDASQLDTYYHFGSQDINNGTVILILTSVSSNSPCAPVSDTIKINLLPPDDAFFSYPTGTFCQTGDPVTPDQINNPGGTFSVSPSGLDINSSTGEINPQNSNTGTYTVTYTTSGTCPNSYSMDITITTGFSADFHYDSDEYCQAGTDPLPIYDNGGSGGTFSSYPSGVSFVSTSTGEIDLSNTPPGTYIITNYIAPSGGCAAAQDEDTITIYEAPHVYIGNDTTLCGGDPVEIVAHLSGSATSVSWSSTGDGTFTSTNDTVTYYIPANTDYNTNIIITATTNNPAGPCEEATDQVSLVFHRIPDIYIVEDQPHCGLSDGRLEAYGGNAVSPYSYEWSTGATTNIIENIPSGIYSVTVTDYFGCTSDTTVNLSDVNGATISVTNQQDVTCYGDTNGAVTISIEGGEPPYTINWSTGDTGLTLSGLSAGTYSVTVTDINSCTSMTDITINQPQELIDSVYVTAPKCNSGNDGRIVVVVGGGTQPYVYNWNTGDMTPTIDSLSSGIYYLTVTDANLCSLTEQIYVPQPNDLSIYATVNQPECIENPDASFVIDSVTGGTPPYVYIFNGSLLDTNYVSGLKPGSYILTVLDSNNCQKDTEITILQPQNSCLIVPTVITPNGDGANDTWNIKGIEYYDNVTIELFNRWGNKIFHFDGKGIEYADVNNQWDGTENGKKVAHLTVFLYIIDLHNGKEPLRGTVVVK
jgi:gliding motility-associated-like protein